MICTNCNQEVHTKGKGKCKCKVISMQSLELLNCDETYVKVILYVKEDKNILNSETTSYNDTNVNVILKLEINTSLIMDKAERVKRLKEHLDMSKINHKVEIMKQSTLKDAHIYCIINNVSAQQFGPLLEDYIRINFNYIKNKAKNCTGDCSKDGKNSEIKVSLGGATHTKFNFVQIRPSHDCTTYILTAYHLSPENIENEGELYIFKVPKEDIKQIVMLYGGYAHGTIKEHGRITIEMINDEKNKKEYALRPTINDMCWKALMYFRVPETYV